MNADAITNSVMDRIRPWLGKGALENQIRYAIYRSHDSVISGLGHGMPTEPLDSAQMFADDATYNTTGDVPCCGHCPILTSSKTRSDRPVASTTESPASAPACGPERVADSGYPIPAHVCHWPNCASAELADEKIARLEKQLAEASAARDAAMALNDVYRRGLRQIADHPHNNYDHPSNAGTTHSNYGIGCADGHRCAAMTARLALGDPTSA